MLYWVDNCSSYGSWCNHNTGSDRNSTWEAAAAARFLRAGGPSSCFVFLAGACRPFGASSCLLRLPSLLAMSLATGLAISPFACDFCATTAFFLCATLQEESVIETLISLDKMQTAVTWFCTRRQQCPTKEECHHPMKSCRSRLRQHAQRWQQLEQQELSSSRHCSVEQSHWELACG